MDPAMKSLSPLVVKVKSLLVKAWRERWSDIKWGIQLKRVMASNPGDPRELAEVLLQQALVGRNPHSLLFLYLKHAVFSQVVPPSAAFLYITHFDDFSRPHCVLALVDLAECFAVNLSLSYCQDTGLTMCKHLQNLIHWLLLSILKFLHKLQDTRQINDCIKVIEAASTAVEKIMDNATVQALLYIARLEDPDNYREFEQTEVNVRGTMSQVAADVVPTSVRQKVASTLKCLSRIQDFIMPSEAVMDIPHLPINPTVNTLVALEAILNPTNDTQPFVEQLIVIEGLMKLNRSRIYCELFRSCFMGLVDSSGSTEELKWAAFTYLKLPQILLKIQQQSLGGDFNIEVEQAFNMLLNSAPLLNLADLKMSCDALMFLMTECKKVRLLDDMQFARLLQTRNNQRDKPINTDATNTQPSANLILKAEPTVTSILKTLDADYSKNQDALSGVLNHMLSGKSFELILAAAAATGKLQSFATKLIKFNEFAKQTVGEVGKAAQTRAMLFDISFLMLTHITQLYGTEIICSSIECSESFFVQWALKCLPDDGKYKCIENAVPTEANKVDVLLNQLSMGELNTRLTRWHDVCTNIPLAIQEVLFAWEHGALATEGVKAILDKLKSQMCCLPVVVSAWLCSYMNTVGEDARSKPLSMLQQLTTTIKPDVANLYYNERSHLMNIILNKLINDIRPANMRSTAQQYIPHNALPSEVMDKTLVDVFAKGWVDLRSLHTLEQLLNLCGSDWFCQRVVTQMLHSNRKDELLQSLSLAFAVFHMDLVHLTLSLLLHFVPSVLQAVHQLHLLTDPRGYIFAKLCVTCIIAAQKGRTAQKELITAKEDGEASPSYDAKDPLNKALVNLFRILNTIVHGDNLSPRTSFIISFINEALKLGGQDTNFILQFMPPNMLSQMLKSFPGVFTNQQIVHICDLSTLAGRKIAAKAVSHNSRL
ncbi:hypothetical protein ScPMuIL_016560 [Solemya velum]